MEVGVEAGRGGPARGSELFNKECPGRIVFDHIANRWGALIITALDDGPLRFHELRDRVGGISEKMLSQNLRTLTGDGLLAREVEPATPPRVSYALTPLGRDLVGHLRGLLDWIASRTEEILAAREGAR